MTPTGIVRRETGISIVINTILSIAFFLGVFGLARPAPLAALGPDFLPQSFMVALMGCLVPGVLVRRRLRGPLRDVVVRALVIAAAALVVAGGGAWALCLAFAPAALPPAAALAVKALFGAALAAVTTPIAVRAALAPAAAR